MLVAALCTAYFSRAKINKQLWPPYFKIWSLYIECSGAGTVPPSPLKKSGHLAFKIVIKKRKILKIKR